MSPAFRSVFCIFFLHAFLLLSLSKFQTNFSSAARAKITENRLTVDKSNDAVKYKELRRKDGKNRKRKPRDQLLSQTGKGKL
jgi:hypothetical protein